MLFQLCWKPYVILSLREWCDLIKKDTLVTVYRIILGTGNEEKNQNTETSLETLIVIQVEMRNGNHMLVIKVVGYLLADELNRKRKHHSRGWFQDFELTNWVSNAIKDWDRDTVVWIDLVLMLVIILKNQALAGVAHWIEHWAGNWKVTGSIPSQGTCLGCGAGPQLGRGRGNQSISHMFLSISPSLPLPLKINKIFKK